jgi:PAS domain-containing protein
MQTVLEESLINLDSLPEAYIRLDSTFRCMFVNQAAQLLLDQAAVGLLGKTLWEVYPENVAKPIEERLRRTMAERAVSRLDLYDQLRKRRYSITAVQNAVRTDASSTAEPESNFHVGISGRCDLAYLPKPFSPESLAVKVREVLTRHPTLP